MRIDTGIHTGRLDYDTATTLFSEVVDFLPGSCGATAKKSDAKRASCDGAERALFRYSKWPTQAIHLAFISQGTIPSGYFHDALLAELQKTK